MRDLTRLYYKKRFHATDGSRKQGDVTFDSRLEKPYSIMLGYTDRQGQWYSGRARGSGSFKTEGGAMRAVAKYLGDYTEEPKTPREQAKDVAYWLFRQIAPKLPPAARNWAYNNVDHIIPMIMGRLLDGEELIAPPAELPARGFTPFPTPPGGKVLPFRRNPRWPQGSEVQSLLFDREQWTPTEAREWLQEHGYKWSNRLFDITEAYVRVRQADPDDFTPGHFATITLGDGIKAVIAEPRA